MHNDGGDKVIATTKVILSQQIAVQLAVVKPTLARSGSTVC